MLVACKCDTLPVHRDAQNDAVPMEEAEALAEANGWGFAATSAKTGAGVGGVLAAVARQGIQVHLEEATSAVTRGSRGADGAGWLRQLLGGPP